MGLESMEIMLPRETYYPGEMITGTARIVVSDSNKPLHYVNITLRGFVKVKWSNGENDDTRRVHHFFSPMELKLTTVQGILAPGTHLIPFGFPLPLGVLSTFQGKYGYICYKLTLLGPDDGWYLFTSRPKVKKRITVVHVIDPNAPEFDTPIRGAKQKMTGCICNETGPIVLQAMIDRTGYSCYGDTIKITASFTNNSKVPVRPYAKVVYERNYIANSSYETRSELDRIWRLADVEGERYIGACQSANWNERVLPMPDLRSSPQSFESLLITSKYFVEVGLEIEDDWALKVLLPITIGSLPYIGGPRAVQEALQRQLPEPPPPFNHATVVQPLPTYSTYNFN